MLTSDIPKQQVQTRNPRTLDIKSLSKLTTVKSAPTNIKPSDNYTIPKVRYKYEQVSWEVFMDNTYDTFKTIRSSFVPYVMFNNKRYWVLGSFYDFPRDILMDFGGSCVLFDPPREFLQPNQRQMRNYQHQFGCAMLELNEESKGLLVKPVLKSLGTDGARVYRGSDNTKREYVWFVMVQLDHHEVKPLVDKFESAPYILKGEKLGPLGFYKESDILNKVYRTTKNLTDFVNHLR